MEKGLKALLYGYLQLTPCSGGSPPADGNAPVEETTLALAWVCLPRLFLTMKDWFSLIVSVDIGCWC
jgi:hypothetical protein